MVRKYVTIPITPETKSKVDDVGRKGQTYNQIIQELLSKWSFEN